MNVQGISATAIAATRTCCEIRLKGRPLAEAPFRCCEPQLPGSCVPRGAAARMARDLINSLASSSVPRTRAAHVRCLPSRQTVYWPEGCGIAEDVFAYIIFDPWCGNDPPPCETSRPADYHDCERSHDARDERTAVRGLRTSGCPPQPQNRAKRSRGSRQGEC